MNKLILYFFCSLFSLAVLADSLSQHEVDTYLQCYHRHQATISDPVEKFNEALKSIPDNELYKLFIDKARLANPEEDERDKDPHLIFDVKEPGYFAAMFKAYKSLPQVIGKELTLEMFVKLHDDAVDGVRGKNGSTLAKGISRIEFGYTIPHLSEAALKELYDSGVLWESNSEAVMNIIRAHSVISEEGHSALQDVLERMLKDKFLARKTLSQDGNRFETVLHSKEQWEKLLAPFFEHFQSALKNTQTLNGKLSAMAELLRALEVAHILPDGNTRTDAFLLLSKFLIENNLPLTILDYPSDFGGHLTVKEMAQRIRQGMTNFLNEKPQFHRDFLATHCTDITRDENWLNGDDYAPYHKVGLGLDKIVTGFLEDWKDTVTELIKTKKMDSRFGKKSALSLSIVLGQPELVKELLKHGAAPALDVEYYPLQESLLHNPLMVETILEHYQNADTSYKNADFKEAAFYLFKKKEKTDKEQALLAQILNQADPNDPLILALRGDAEGFKKSMELYPRRLFESGSDSSILPFVVDRFGKIALEILGGITNFSDEEILQLRKLLSHKVGNLDTESVRTLLDLGIASQLIKVERGSPILFEVIKALRRQNVNRDEDVVAQASTIIDLLINKDANVKHSYKNSSLLHVLVSNLNLPNVAKKILQEKELTAEEKSVKFNSVMDRMLKMANFLIQKGVDPSAKNKDQKTAYSLLEEYRKKIIKVRAEQENKSYLVPTEEDLLLKFNELTRLLDQ
jgi:hypothetical protein